MELTDGQKIKAIREHHGMSYAKFSKKLGTSSAGHISDVEKGKHVASNILISLIRFEFRVNPAWWDTGEGEMVKVTSVAPERFHALVSKVAPHDTLATTTCWILERMAELVDAEEPERMARCAAILQGVKRGLE